MIEYERDGALIYERSFATIRAEADLSRFSAAEAEVAVRMIHACGMPQIAPNIVFAPGAIQAARQALDAAGPIFCDSEMVSHGIIRSRLPRENDVVCTLRDAAVPGLASSLGNTRSAAAVDLWSARLAGAVVAIGNAPTALYRLLEILESGTPRPALIVGIPVGFVGAEESKDALIQNSYGVPFVTVRGRCGGSAITAAAINALARSGL